MGYLSSMIQKKKTHGHDHTSLHFMNEAG